MGTDEGKVGSRQQIKRLQSEYHVGGIALIGSFARNEQRVGSDVDLLLDLEPDTPDIYQTKRRLRIELETAFGRHVELASERYLKPYYGLCQADDK